MPEQLDEVVTALHSLARCRLRHIAHARQIAAGAKNAVGATQQQGADVGVV